VSRQCGVPRAHKLDTFRNGFDWGEPVYGRKFCRMALAILEI